MIARNGHFFRRSYYWATIGGVLGWYFWDDAIDDDDPIIPTFVSLPVCDDDTDDCDVQPVSVVYSVPGAAPRPQVPAAVDNDSSSGPGPRRASTSRPVSAGRAQAGCLLVLYQEPDFDGQSWQTSLNQPTLDNRWNERIESLQVFSGNWDFFAEGDYNGDTMTLEPGSYSDLGDDWKDKIASFKCVAPEDAQQQ